MKSKFSHFYSFSARCGGFLPGFTHFLVYFLQVSLHPCTVTRAAVHAVAAAEYPHSTINGTPTCSSHIGAVLYETHVIGQED